MSRNDTTDSAMLIWTDLGDNKNRFYSVVLNSDDTVVTRFGRVGEPGRTINLGRVGRSEFDKIIAKKLKKGYKKVLVADSAEGRQLDSLRTAARTTLIASETDQRLADLVDRLVSVNAHEITRASGGRLEVQDGQIRTPLGLLTQTAIDEARAILANIQSNPGRRQSLMGDYMSLVPQDVGRGREWVRTFLADRQQLDQQSNFLDQLEQSLDFARQQAQATTDSETYDDIFKYRIRLLEDTAVFKQLEKAFKDSRSTRHSSRLVSSRIKNIYVFEDADAVKTYEDTLTKIKNPIKAWHGTRAMNLLSIASNGLKSPREMKTLYTTGAMFGRGIYTSTCSTKSLGYSDSGIWGTSSSDTHYLFSVDVALGNAYRPGTSYSHPNYDQILDGKVKDSKGLPYHSIDVAAGTGGVYNPETIVPNSSQIAIRYLLELSSR